MAGWGEHIIPPSPEHGPGRMRIVHSNAMIYGFVVNVLLASMFAAGRARSGTGGLRPIFAVAGFLLYQGSVFVGVTAAFYGRFRAVAGSEMMGWTDAALAGSLALIFWSWLGPTRGEKSREHGAGRPLLILAGGAVRRDL